jgi:uncharacterized membrane protein
MTGPHKVPSVHEIRTSRTPVRDVNAEQHNQFTALERLAIAITERVGTMGFFFIIFAWTATWLGWNTIGPSGMRFDPYPAFVLWLFISNMIQIFLMPLLMIGQNLQGRHSEIRAQSDYEVNVKAEKEIDAILMHLENLHAELEQIEARLDGLPGAKPEA